MYLSAQVAKKPYRKFREFLKKVFLIFNMKLPTLKKKKKTNNGIINVATHFLNLDFRLIQEILF